MENLVFFRGGERSI